MIDDNEKRWGRRVNNGMGKKVRNNITSITIRNETTGRN